MPDQIQCVPGRDVPDDLVALEVELPLTCLMFRWKCFGSCSRKYIRITMPKNIEMTGMFASIPRPIRSELTAKTRPLPQRSHVVNQPRAAAT